MQSRVRRSFSRVLALVMTAAATFACSKEPSELPECGDYRTAEVRAELALKNAESLLAEIEPQLEVQRAKVDELLHEVMDRMRDEAPPGELGYQRNARERVVRRELSVEPAWTRLEELEQLAQRTRNEVASKTLENLQAVTIRVSQGCAAPKPVFESSDQTNRSSG